MIFISSAVGKIAPENRIACQLHALTDHSVPYLNPVGYYHACSEGGSLRPVFFVCSLSPHLYLRNIYHMDALIFNSQAACVI